MDRAFHDSLYVVDGAQYSNWDRTRLLELQAGGLSLVHVTVAYWENARQTLSLLADWNRRFRDFAELIRPVREVADLAAPAGDNRVGIILGAQHISPIDDDLGLVAIMRRLGLCIMQLSYNNQSLVAAGCYEADDPGITRFGREVIREMNRVGLIIDMSHSAERSTLEAIELSARPICISHANPLSFQQSARNKSDVVLRALAETGGLLGFSLYPLHLRDKSDCSLAAFCQMVADTAELMGVDHLGIGSDLCRGWPYEVVEWMRNGRWTYTTNYGEGRPGERAWPRQPAWFNSPADMPNLTQGLLDHGFAKAEVAKIMGGNWRRFLHEGLGEQGQPASAEPTGE